MTHVRSRLSHLVWSGYLLCVGSADVTLCRCKTTVVCAAGFAAQPSEAER
jgi:hypothetical protein